MVRHRNNNNTTTLAYQFYALLVCRDESSYASTTNMKLGKLGKLVKHNNKR